MTVASIMVQGNRVVPGQTHIPVFFKLFQRLEDYQ